MTTKSKTKASAPLADAIVITTFAAGGAVGTFVYPIGDADTSSNLINAHQDNSTLAVVATRRVGGVYTVDDVAVNKDRTTPPVLSSTVFYDGQFNFSPERWNDLWRDLVSTVKIEGGPNAGQTLLSDPEAEANFLRCQMEFLSLDPKAPQLAAHAFAQYKKETGQGHSGWQAVMAYMFTITAAMSGDIIGTTAQLMGQSRESVEEVAARRRFG